MTRLEQLGAVVMVSLLALCGCRTGSGPDRQAGKPEAGAEAKEREDARSLEQRAEAEARFMAGISHEVNDEPEQGLEDFYAAAQADLGNEALVLDLSTRFIFLKRYDKAASLLTKALAQPNASALLDARLAFVQLQTGKTNAAIHSYQNAIKKAPHSIIGYEGLFHTCLQSGQTNEARRVLEDAAKVAKPDAGFLVDFSEMCFLQSRVEPKAATNLTARAREALNRAVSMNPSNFFTLQKLADGLTQTGDRKQAAAVLLKIQELYPDMPAIRERLVNLFLRDKDTQGATEQLEALVRDNPTDPQAYYLLGIIDFDEHRYKEAAEHFRKALLLKADLEPAYYELAICRINQDQCKEALETLAQARAKFSTTFLTEYCTSLAYMRLKDYTNAVRYLTSAEIIASATDTNRLTHIFYFQLGSANERAGRWTEAEANLRKSLKLSPDFVETLNYLGYMWAEKGTNLAEAREMIEKAVKQEPDNAAYLDSLAWVLFKQGRPREALRPMQRALELSKEPDATLYDHLGDILAALREPEKAREAWRKALALEPTPEIRKKLEPQNR
jgi:tetratricopeptide (TPR) repeat protein